MDAGTGPNDRSPPADGPTPDQEPDTELSLRADYFRKIHDRFIAADHDGDYPDREWLITNDFRYFLTRIDRAGYTVEEFFTDVVTTDYDYDWGIDSDVTKAEFEEYLESARRRNGIADSTLASKRSRLATYARVYQDLYGSGDIIMPATEHVDYDDAFREAVYVFDELESRLGVRSVPMYFSDVNQFYNRLLYWGKVAHNPVENIPNEFDWEQPDPKNKAISVADITAMLPEIESVENQLILYGLAAWGLRPNEVASLHRRQVVNLPDAPIPADCTMLGAEAEQELEHPVIVFDEKRKNGPGSVSVLYGAELLCERFQMLSETMDDWSGYAFPSVRSSSGHLITETIRNRFQDMAEAAGVVVDGELPKAHMGRRFWYRAYQSALEGVVAAQLEHMGEEQGSSDTDVISENYLTEDRMRRMRKAKMRAELQDAFGGPAVE